MGLPRRKSQFNTVIPEILERQISKSFRGRNGALENSTHLLLHGDAVFRSPDPETLIKIIINSSNT